MGKILALDVGGRRIGVAEGDESLKIAYPVTTIIVDGHELEKLAELVRLNQPSSIVVGYPRNQSGEVTEQTKVVETFAQQLAVFEKDIIFQDESLTSVVAEQHLRALGEPYTKEMIDAEAAALILQDYLEGHYGH